MRLRLGDLQPFNFPDQVSNETARQFLAHFAGSEEFDFDGHKRPVAVLLTTVEFTSSRSGVAKGLLLTIDPDTFDRLGQAESDPTGMYDQQALVKRYCVGLLKLRLEPVWYVSVSAVALRDA